MLTLPSPADQEGLPQVGVQEGVQRRDQPVHHGGVRHVAAAAHRRVLAGPQAPPGGRAARPGKTAAVGPRALSAGRAASSPGGSQVGSRKPRRVV